MMIIKTPRSLPGQLIDGLLTALAWLVFLYLLFMSVRSAMAAAMADAAAPPPADPFANPYVLLTYTIISMCIGLLLYLWACYNELRFSNAERRKVQTPLSDWALAASFRVNPAQITDLHASRSIRIQHNADGLISVMALDAQPEKRPDRVIDLAAWRQQDTSENKLLSGATDIDCQELQVT